MFGSCQRVAIFWINSISILEAHRENNLFCIWALDSPHFTFLDIFLFHASAHVENIEFIICEFETFGPLSTLGF